jgi:hypothetical protein
MLPIFPSEQITLNQRFTTIIHFIIITPSNFEKYLDQFYRLPNNTYCLEKQVAKYFIKNILTFDKINTIFISS